MRELLFETDWLASQPVFYNERTGLASHSFNDVVDPANLELHPEGFNNYLDFGYSVLEQTPVRGVRFLRHSSRLWREDSGRLRVEYLDDPVDQWMDYRLPEDGVTELIRERVRAWERSVEGEIVVPTSGGFDSRLLNWCVADKSRIRAFSYGLSEDQAASYEVVYARRLSEILGTGWERIPLGDFHLDLSAWDRLFGVSTHAHGMYHIEFYRGVVSMVEGGNPFLSGINGSAWAGDVSIPPLRGQGDVVLLGHTHGLNGDSTKSFLPREASLVSRYWESCKVRLEDPRLRIVEMVRFKRVLLCYLQVVPEKYGFRWWSPFPDIDIAMAMLNLPASRRRDRTWQRDLFRREGLDLEAMCTTADYRNTLDMQALDRFPLKPLDVGLLREVVSAEYVEDINRKVCGGPLSRREKSVNAMLRVPKVRGGLLRLGVLERTRRHPNAYAAYMVLLPIEKALRRRDEASR